MRYALAHALVRHVSRRAQLAVVALLWIGVALNAPMGEVRVRGETPVRAGIQLPSGGQPSRKTDSRSSPARG